jgi:hypothetical protein
MDNMEIVHFTSEEQQAMIHAIHLAQDMMAEASDSLARSSSPSDLAMSAHLDKQCDVLDSARRKLGDDWEPSPEFVVPGTIEGLEL